MEIFTTQHTLSDILSADIFKDYSQYLMYNNPDGENMAPPGVDSKPLSDLSEAGWFPDSVVNGVNCLAERIEAGHVSKHHIYSSYGEDEKQKAHVNFIRITPDVDYSDKPAIVLCSGGAYFAVCTLVESLTTAPHFLQAGYQVFVFTYRVGELGVTPKAIDDLAAGVAYLRDHAKEFNLDPEKLVIGGFSAGANLISNFGTTNIGYKAYGLPKPLALLPVYTFIDLRKEAQRDANGGLLAPMFGPNYMEFLDKYNIAEHIDSEYPPCYITCGKDDVVVPPRNSELLKELLDKAGVPAILDEGDHAPHGFGDGGDSDVQGWPERAIEFIQSLQ